MLSDRELDLLVAQHVMCESVKQRTHDEMGLEGIVGGGFVSIRCVQCGKEWRRLQDIDILCSAPPDPRPYSTTGDGLLAVVEKMRERGFWVSLTTRRIAGDDFLAKAWNFDVERTAEDPSAPRAVAISALRAIGVTVDA